LATVGLSKCSCSPSLDALVCARCGGVLPTLSGVSSRIDLEIQQWFYDLDFESRLNSSLAMYMAIDRQVRQGMPVTVAVQQAVKEIGSDLTGLREQIEQGLAERFDELRDQHATSVGQMREILSRQVELMLTEIKTLVDQGKSVAEIEGRVREATLTLQNYMTAMRLPGVKGEEGETNVIRDLQDAFMGQSDVRIEPVGGADATDAVLRFFHGEIEIGRSLVEVKSRKTWSNDYVDQVRNDMKRYNTPLAMLAVDKLPKTAKSKRFHVDIGRGVVITAAPELVVPTMTMFYQIHAASYAQQKRALNFQSLATDRDLVFCVNDNMKILDDCKKISDVADDSAKKIKEHVTSISSRLHENNRKIAELLTKFPNAAQEC